MEELAQMPRYRWLWPSPEELLLLEEECGGFQFSHSRCRVLKWYRALVEEQRSREEFARRRSEARREREESERKERLERKRRDDEEWALWMSGMKANPISGTQEGLIVALHRQGWKIPDIACGVAISQKSVRRFLIERGCVA